MNSILYSINKNKTGIQERVKNMSDYEDKEFDEWTLADKDGDTIAVEKAGIEHSLRQMAEAKEQYLMKLAILEKNRAQEQKQAELYSVKMKNMTRSERKALFDTEYEHNWTTLGKELEAQQKIEEEKSREMFEKFLAEYHRNREKEKTVASWKNLNTDNFHLDLIKYKKTHTHEDFCKIWPTLQRLNQLLSWKYFQKKISMEAKVLLWGDANSNDYSEWLTEVMLKAIETWEPDRGVKFATYYDRVANNLMKDYLVQENSEYYTGVKLLSLDVLSQEKLMNEAIKNHDYYNQDHNMFVKVYFELFEDILAKKDEELTAIFKLLLERYTREEIAERLKCSKKTIQRKTAEIKQRWKNYTEE